MVRYLIAIVPLGHGIGHAIWLLEAWTPSIMSS